MTYKLEFILCANGISEQEIQASISEFTEQLTVGVCQSASDTQQEFKLVMFTEDPTLIFDTCGQWGKIKGVKVSEIERPGVSGKG